MRSEVLETLAQPRRILAGGRGEFLAIREQEPGKFADTLYINFKKPSYATDSELTDDDVIIRYHDEEVIGFTILHASQRV